MFVLVPHQAKLLHRMARSFPVSAVHIGNFFKFSVAFVMIIQLRLYDGFFAMAKVSNSQWLSADEQVCCISSDRFAEYKELCFNHYSIHPLQGSHLEAWAPRLFVTI